MSSQRRFGFRAHLCVLAAAALAPMAARAQVTAAPGWATYSISTPGVVNGDVVRVGDVVLVGQGAFGAGTQSIVRLENGMATTIATGFNALGGFALDAAGTLYVVDNGGNTTGALTGDTVFAIPDALGRTTALPAVGAEVVPAGTIPAAADVVLDGTTLLVSDAVGPGAGRVVRIENGMVSNLVTGLDYAAGLTIDGTRLLVGNVDGSFVGAVLEYTLAGAPVAPFVGGLSGNYAHAFDNAGNVLITGGFRDDFSSSTLLAVSPSGEESERAWGFAFSSGLFHDTARDETLVLDVAVSRIDVICPDGDGDGTCDADECAALDAKLVLKKQQTPPGDDGLKLRGRMILPAAAAVDPAATGVRVEIADAAGVVTDVLVPPGAGWRVNRAGTVWKHLDPAGPGGIVKVVVRTVPATPGLVKVVVVGKADDFATEPGALPLRAAVALGAGACGEAAYAAEACAFNGRGSTVACQ